MAPDLAEVISEFTRLVFDGSHLLENFWMPHTSTKVSAIEEKAWLLTCGDILRRITGGGLPPIWAGYHGTL